MAAMIELRAEREDLGRADGGMCQLPSTDVVRATSAWIATVPGEWWVLHTRARNEKRVVAALEEHGVSHYLPLVCVRHTYAKRRATFQVPLFPGYVFLCGGHRDCDVARQTNRVAAVLVVVDQSRLRLELQQVCRAIERDEAVELYPALQAGQRCRMTGGPLKGIEGVVVRHGGRCRMHLSVSMLGQSAMVEVDAALLEVVN